MVGPMTFVKNPRVTIVTPSYNQAQFLEETIESVLNQDHPNLEYVVIDGGSTDGSVDIIRKYSSRLAYWVSEPDRGQTDAINKGLEHASGEILGWLNSDDVFEPGSIREAVEHLNRHSQSQAVFGDADFIDPQGNFESHFEGRAFKAPKMFFERFVPQPAVFFRRSALEQAGGLNPSLHYAMDYDLWWKMALVGPIDYVPRTWAKYRRHPDSKSTTSQAWQWTEAAASLKELFARSDIPAEWRKYKAQAMGSAHWYAAIEFHRKRDEDRTKKEIISALEYAPDFIRSHDFAGMLVGGLANQVTIDTLSLVGDFFDLIPSTVSHKQAARRRARARTEALVAINNSTPPALARQHARNALQLDQSWLSNRHVLRRALG